MLTRNAWVFGIESCLHEGHNLPCLRRKISVNLMLVYLTSQFFFNTRWLEVQNSPSMWRLMLGSDHMISTWFWPDFVVADKFPTLSHDTLTKSLACQNFCSFSPNLITATMCSLTAMIDSFWTLLPKDVNDDWSGSSLECCESPDHNTVRTDSTMIA